MKKIVGAFDIGASGGKFIVGIFDEGKFSTSEIYRFVNKPVNLYLTPKGKSPTVHKIYWNDLSIYDEIITGLKKLSEVGITHLDSLGIDTWGTDGECFTEDGEIVGRVHNYRDHRLDKIRGELFRIIPEKELFQLTVSIVSINPSNVLQAYLSINPVSIEYRPNHAEIKIN